MNDDELNSIFRQVRETTARAEPPRALNERLASAWQLGRSLWAFVWNMRWVLVVTGIVALIAWALAAHQQRLLIDVLLSTQFNGGLAP